MIRYATCMTKFELPNVPPVRSPGFRAIQKGRQHDSFVDVDFGRHSEIPAVEDSTSESTKCSCTRANAIPNLSVERVVLRQCRPEVRELFNDSKRGVTYVNSRRRIVAGHGNSFLLVDEEAEVGVRRVSCCDEVLKAIFRLRENGSIIRILFLENCSDPSFFPRFQSLEIEDVSIRSVPNRDRVVRLKLSTDKK